MHHHCGREKLFWVCWAGSLGDRSVYRKAFVFLNVWQRFVRASCAGAVGSTPLVLGEPHCLELVAHSPIESCLCSVPGSQQCYLHILCQQQIEIVNCPESLSCFLHTQPTRNLLSQPAPCSCSSCLARCNWGTSVSQWGNKSAILAK